MFSRPRPHRVAIGTLLLVTFFWGWTFVVVKEAVERVPVYWFLFLRFGVAAALLAAMAVVETLLARRAARAGLASGGLPHPRGSGIVSELGAGAILGLFLFGGYAAQTIGLEEISATKSAFLTGTLALWTPFLTFATLRRRPEAATLFATPTGLVGLYLLMHAPGETWSRSISRGDVATLFCAFMFAAHIAATKRLTHRHSAVRLAAGQVATVAALSGIFSWAGAEPRPARIPEDVVGAILFCALFATVFAFWAQTRMQRHATEEETALLFLFEPVFAALTAFAVRGERMTAVQWVGAGLILAATLLPEIVAFGRARRASAS